MDGSVGMEPVEKADAGSAKVTDGKDIVREIREGNILAIIKWMEGNRDRLYKIAMVYSGNKNIDSVFEKAIVGISENIKGLKDERQFEPWAVSMLLNECRRYVPAAGVARVLDEVSCDQSSSTIGYVRKLKGIGKDAVVLKYYGGFSIDEISLILRMSLDEVRHEIYNGLKGITAEANKAVRS